MYIYGPFTLFHLHRIWNKLNIKYQWYPKLRTLDTFRQEISFCHNPGNEFGSRDNVEENEKCLFSNTQEFLHNIFITSFK